MSDTLTPRAPSRLNLLREAVSIVDMVGLPKVLLASCRRANRLARPYPIIVMPGLGAGDNSTRPLRYFLSQHGYKTEGWGIGVNNGGSGLIENLSELSESWDVDRTRPNNGEGNVPALSDKMAARVKARSEKLGSKIVVVGWSLGGVVARECARILPDHVAGVITMGTPVVGGPKYTSVAPLYKARNVDLDWIETEINKRAKTVPITQPITAIFSKLDGVVGWQAAIDTHNSHVNHIQVNVSHFGLGLNAKVWNITLEALENIQ